MLGNFETVLLDMNDTFMFGHDRFGAEESYGATYKKLGGALSEQEARKIVQAVFDYLEPLYPDLAYRECFPSLSAALDMVVPEAISGEERRRLIATFAHHEFGTIPLEYAEALRELGSRFRLGLVADIWAPSEQWLSEFERAGVLDAFEALSFSSDDGVVKPSGKSFIKVLAAMDADPATAVMIGDSVRRDLGGAVAAELPCILVGGKTDPAAYGAAPSLLNLL
ncbi:HAD family hydrolase [Marinobacter salarius]